MKELTLDETAKILGKTPDETMFLVQSGKLNAGIDQDNMAWKFVLDDVLAVKETLAEGFDPKLLME